MLTRRGFLGCALCATGAFIAEDVSAQTPPAAPSGFKRTVLSQIDAPTTGYAIISVLVEIEPGFTIGRHTHPGVESSVFSDGGGTLVVDGQADRDMKVGDAFQVPGGVPHAFKNGTKTSKVVATYVVEKGKPLATPA